MFKRFAAFWLSLLAAAILSAIPAAATSEPEEPTSHTHRVESWTVLENGHSGLCADCGETVTQEHAMGAGTVTLEPTCQAEGTRTFTCICGHSYQEAIPKLTDHVCNQWAAGEAQHTGTCVHCGTEMAADHSYDAGTVTLEPTCTANGEKTLTCTLCGHTKKEIITAPGHTYGKWESVDGTYHKHVCACGHSAQEQHTWNGGVITRYPSCDKYGIKTYTCTGCGAVKHVETYRTSHKYSSVCDVTCNNCGFIRRPQHNFSTTWSTDDTDHWHTCTICHLDGDKEPHTPSDWIVDTPAGEYTDGQRHQECTVCGRILIKETIPATGCLHGNEELRGVKDPTCIFEGHTGDWVCPRCEEVVIPGEPIPTLPHNPAIQHQKDATCTQEGYTGDSVCQGCLAILEKGKTIPVLPHSTVIENQKDPTCTQEGYTGDHICQDCRTLVTKGEAIAPVPHQTQLHGAREPGCISDGHSGDHICKYCLRIIEPGYAIPQTGHEFIEGFCKRCGAIDPDHVFPDTPSLPIGSDLAYEPLPLSPVIIAAIAMLGITGIGIVVLIVLIAKKK